MRLYVGMAGIKAVRGLEAATCQEKGGIIQCHFVAAFLVPQGCSLCGTFPEGLPTSTLMESHSTPPLVLNGFSTPWLTSMEVRRPRSLLFKGPKGVFYENVVLDVVVSWVS